MPRRLLEDLDAYHRSRVDQSYLDALAEVITVQSLNDVLTPTEAPGDVADTAAVGDDGVGYAKANHGHRHGPQVAKGTYHAVVDATENGFMSVADKIALDILVATPPGSLADGDYGDIVVSGGGTVLTVDAGVIDAAKTSIANAPDGTKLLRDDWTWQPAPSGASATTVEVSLVEGWTGKFTITDAAIGAASKVLCWQAPGPYTGKGTLADEAELAPVQVLSVEPAVGSAVVKWQTPPAYVTLETFGSGKRDNPASGLAQRGLPLVLRIGRVRGNTKFSYMVLT